MLISWISPSSLHLRRECPAGVLPQGDPGRAIADAIATAVARRPCKQPVPRPTRLCLGIGDGDLRRQ
jgi:hypothetical protein